ncbi:GNAT family N-acetyltransferase [Calidifontibacter terrae]
MDFLTEADARAALDATGLTWRSLGRDDLPATAEFYAQCETHDENPERTAVSRLEEFWDSPRSRPEEDTLIGVAADGSIVAAAWSGCNRSITERRGVFLNGAVRPDRRGAGNGRAVLAWEMAHANAWDAATREAGFGPLVVKLFAPVAQSDVRHLAERAGLEIERYFYEMSRPLDGSEMSPALEGISVIGWDPARSREAHVVHDVAFRDHWGHADMTEEMWDEGITGVNFRPDWSLMAIDDSTGEMVGVAINCAYEQDWKAQGFKEGYTNSLGVLRSHRGRGIASALLKESMVRFNATGMTAAGLGVDAANPSGALGLYEGLGYRRTASTCAHQYSSDSFKPDVGGRQ